jgi:cell division septation protein DedD
MTTAGYISSLFASDLPTPPPPRKVSFTTGSTDPVEPETSSWSDSKEPTAKKAAKTADKKSKANTKSILAVTDTGAAPSSKAGKYKVHIAALRSRAEAEALAQKLVTEHAADLSNHIPTVDETVIGSMGTFYRVRILGYASQDEPRGLCNKLRTSGLDCLVVTN